MKIRIDSPGFNRNETFYLSFDHCDARGAFQHVLSCGVWVVAGLHFAYILMSFLCLLFSRFLKTTLKILLHKRHQQPTFCWRPTNKIQNAINKAAFFFPLTVCNVRHTNVQHARMAFSTQVSVSNYEILPSKYVV